MDYAAEIEQIAAEARRRSAILMDEIDDINRRTSLRADQLAVEAAEQLRALTESEMPEAEPGLTEPQPVQYDPAPPVTRHVPAPPPFVPDPTMSPEQQQQAEIRAAIARAKAAREARSTVAPSDGDYDSESEYYRRSTWLD
ncbi:hypothetical protein ACIA5E_23340 [Nocardia asteroides]|uniref:hypothetical protein n=1 Tax=Nocardia asteroides TaxID=1824 RepID=UPI003787CEF1